MWPRGHGIWEIGGWYLQRQWAFGAVVEAMPMSSASADAGPSAGASFSSGGMPAADADCENGDAQELLKLKHTQTFSKTGVVDHLQRVEKTRRGRC